MYDCIHIAAKMLDIDPHSMFDTHRTLHDRLLRVNGLCIVAAGQLVSRQVIAILVDEWKSREVSITDDDVDAGD